MMLHNCNVGPCQPLRHPLGMKSGLLPSTKAELWSMNSLFSYSCLCFLKLPKIGLMPNIVGEQSRAAMAFLKIQDNEEYSDHFRHALVANYLGVMW